MTAQVRTGPMRLHHFVVGIILAVACAGPVRAAANDAARFYEDAQVRFDRGDTDGAILQLRNALQKEPKMLAAQLLLGRALLKSGDAPAAEVVLSKALELGVDRSEVALPLAQAYAAQGKLETMLERSVVDGLPRRTQVELLILRGNAKSELGDFAAARQAFEQARMLEPDSIDVRVARATALLRTGQLAELPQLLAELIRLAPNDARAWNLHGAAAHVSGDLQQAMSDYNKALSLEPDNADAQAVRAGLLIDLGRFEEADQAVTRLQRTAPGEPRGAYLRAVLAARANDTPTVRRSLGEVVALLDPVPKRVLARQSQMLMLGALAHYALGNNEKAADYLAIQVRANPNQPGPAKLLASIYLARKDVARTIALLEPLRKAAPGDPQLLSLLAAAHMAERRYGAAADILDEAVRSSGGAADLRSQYGVALIDSGQQDLGFTQLQQAFAKDPGQARAGVLLSTLLLNQGHPRRALEIIDVVAKRYPANFAAANLQGVVHVAAGDAAGGRAAYERALSLNARYYGAAYNLARLDRAEKKPDAARARLTEILKVDQRNASAMFELALLEEESGSSDEATRWLEKAMADPKQRVEAGSQLTEMLIRRREFERALNIAKDIASAAPRNYQALRALGRAELAIGNGTGARQVFMRMATVAGFDPVQNVEIARLQLAADDREQATYSVGKALNGDANNLPALVLQAELSLRAGDFAKAEQQAKRLSERPAAQATGLRLLGDVAATRNQPAIALTHYRSALAKDQDPETAIRAYRVYGGSGEAAKGLLFLEQWAREHGAQPAIHRALADGYLQTGKLEAARGRYEQLLQEQPDNVDVLNNLAVVFDRQGDSGSVKFAERAYALAAKDASVIDTLGWILVRQGQVERGMGLLRDARLRDSGNPNIRYHLAAALAKAGREAEARGELEAALKEGGDFESAEEARRLLKGLKP